MNRRILILLVPTVLVATAGLLAFASPTASVPSAVAADTYDIDAGHTGVLFSIRHLGVGQFYGRFNGVEGTYRMDPKDLSKTSVTADIATKTVDTANKNRDKHLRASDFFDAGQFPKATFESTTAKSTGDKGFTLEGNLKMLGVTKPVTLEAEFIGEGADPWGGYRTGFTAHGTIKRSDFNMNYGLNNGVLGDEVELIISVEGVKRKE